MYDVIIIGAGFAGYTAAIYAARHKLKALVIAKQPGGAIINSGNVENYPGYRSIPGHELMHKFEDQARAFGAEMLTDEVIGIVKEKDGFRVETRQEIGYQSKSIIIATGTERRRLEIPGGKEFEGKGVHYCATCDAAFYRGKTVAVIGGSNSAAHAALLLARFAKKVYVLYRGDGLRCEPILGDQAQGTKNIEIVCGVNVAEVKGKEFVQKAVLDKAYNGRKEIEIDGLFVEIGSVPSSALAKELGVELSHTHEIMVDAHCATNVRGVFAAGDVTNTVLKQGITAAAQGAIAASSTYHFVTGKTDKGAWQ
jgi:thioredoxin reductase (NADPH)